MEDDHGGHEDPHRVVAPAKNRKRKDEEKEEEKNLSAYAHRPT
jgi:hypothetical protein